MWDNPKQYKESYRFIVTWQSVDGTLRNKTKDMKYNITNLVPGTSYNINVTTETSDGTQGDSREISNCTGMVAPDQFTLYKHIAIRYLK